MDATAATVAMEGETTLPDATRPWQDSIQAAHLDWDAARLDVSRLPEQPGGVDRAIARWLARLPEAVHSDAFLEGNTYTLPEVTTLLDGVGVDGRTLAETQQVLALSQASRYIADLATTGLAVPTRAISDELNRMVTAHESIEPGVIRGTGTVGGGGHVNAMGTAFDAPAPGAYGSALVDLFHEGADHIASSTGYHPAADAVLWAAWATYNQFYFDGNKRTARHVMNLILLSRGFDAIMIPTRTRTRYHQALTDMFLHGDPVPYAQFLLDQYPI